MAAPCSADAGEPGAGGFVAEYLPALLTQAAQRLVGDFADQVGRHGLSVLEWRVLATLADGGALPLGLLARRAATKQPTLTRLMDRMERQGLVTRGVGPGDRRQSVLRITDAGHGLVDGLIAEARARQSRQRERLGEARWQQLLALLRLL